ncbi:hypothetical protein N7454_002353 [Penicillium verhagenii]|nr:hypothetical protein N7454_002353 [Penicillium verhagenii]
MALSNAALIVIILVCCLSSVSLAAAMFGHYSVTQNPQWSPSNDQKRYMRELRIRSFNALLGHSKTKDQRPLRPGPLLNKHDSFATDPEAQSVAYDEPQARPSTSMLE